MVPRQVRMLATHPQQAAAVHAWHLGASLLICLTAIRLFVIVGAHYIVTPLSLYRRGSSSGGNGATIELGRVVVEDEWAMVRSSSDTRASAAA